METACPMAVINWEVDHTHTSTYISTCILYAEGK